jgi:deoxyribonuclease-4
MIIGCHVKMTAPLYLEGSVKEALSYGANALMLYTGAPQNTRRSPISIMHVQQARQLMKDNGLGMDRMIVHAPYLINPANSVKPEVAELADSFLNSEIQRTAEIGARYLVLHPGAYTTADPETGINTAIHTLNALQQIPEGVVICLETMAGKGSEIGISFEQLEAILSRLNHPEHFGVCLDTCHINDAGMDVRNFDAVLDRFDEIIGLSNLHVIHLNDSKNERGSHKDRHANLGMGTIGFEPLHAAALNPRTAHIAKILETPYINEQPPYRTEIAMLNSGNYDPDWTAQYEKKDAE